VITAAILVPANETDAIRRLLEDGWVIQNVLSSRDDGPRILFLKGLSDEDGHRWLTSDVDDGSANVPKSTKLLAAAGSQEFSENFIDPGTQFEKIASVFAPAAPTPQPVQKDNDPTSSPASAIKPVTDGREFVELLLNAVDPHDKAALAKSYLETLVQRELWTLAPEMVLVNQMTEGQVSSEKRKLLGEVLDVKLGGPTKHAQFLSAAAATAVEIKAQTKTWGRLIWPAVAILVVGVLASFVFTARGFDLVAKNQMKGYELVGVIFVLALTAISPAVLLLLQRPLAGIDAWSPGALKQDDKKGDDATNLPEPGTK
jgi:hypothetical protein